MSEENKLKQYAECMKEQLEGREFKISGEPKKSSIKVREAFKRAAELCKQKINEGGKNNG
jgi:hypothetical protein